VKRKKKVISVVVSALALAFVVLTWLLSKLSVNAWVNNRASWPENIFELANVREVAIILAVIGLVLFGISKSSSARKMIKRVVKDFKQFNKTQSRRQTRKKGDKTV